MKIITIKKQRELNEMIIKKLRFVARETYLACSRQPQNFSSEGLELAQDRAEQVFFADNVV